MSTGDDNIPWNKSPKNGINAFFSAATFGQWVGEDTHESRLLDRLKKVNVSLSSKQPSGPWFLPSSNKAVTKSNKPQVCTNSPPCEVNAVVDKSAAKTQNKEKIDILAQKLWSDVHGDNASGLKYGSDYITETTLQAKQSHRSKDKIYTSKLGDSNDKAGPEHEVADMHQQTSESDEVARKQTVDVVNKIYDAAKLESCGELGDITDDLDKEVSAGIDGSETTIVKPGFFYRDSTQATEDISENVESLEDISNQIDDHSSYTKPDHYQAGNSSSKLANNPPYKAEETNAWRKAGSANIETEADSNNTGKRGYVPLDPMFYNIKDRKAEKYFAEIFKKKPKMRFSKLTSHEQKVYLELLQMYGKANLTEQDLANESYHKYVKMTEIVSREQQAFQSYLRNISRICKADYEYIHPEVEKYVTARFLRKKKDTFTYPRFYNFIGKFELTDDIPDSPPTLQYIRPLVKLGHVSKLVLPSILPGLPQPCVTTNCKKIDEICPIVPKVYSGTYVWNNVVCSRDANAEQLAVPNKCDVVMSSSSVKHLVDNQGTIYKYWDMPFTVREYKLTEGDVEKTHKVLYIDKPIIRQSQFVPKERIQLYQKYAIRASSVRNNQRGHMFCGIKPVHEVVANQDVNEIAEQIKEYEEKLKDTFETVSVRTESEDSNVQKDMRKRKRKGASIRQKTQGGMFDAQDDIDDLETFGMDSYVGLKGKGVEAVNSKMDNEVKESRLPKTKSREDKSAVKDLELLRKELSGIKSLAIKEVTQTNEARVSDEKEKPWIEERQTQKVCLSNDDIKRNTDNKMLDTKDMKDNVHASNTEPKSDITKCGVLSVKNLSSFSEKMKQTSAIKDELEKKTKECEPPSVLEQTLSIPTEKSASPFSETESADKAVCKDVEVKTLDTDEDNTVLFDAETASDSDEEALIIDLPTDDNGSQKITKSVATLNKEDTANYESDLKFHLNDQATICTDTQESMPGLKVESSDAKSRTESLNTRRKRQCTIKPSGGVTVPKRLLRSAANKEQSPVSTCLRVTRSRVQKLEAETSCDTAGQAESNTGISPAGRGRKRTCSDNRMTSCRSMSAEDHQTLQGEKINTRTSRRSLTSNVDESSTVGHKINLLPWKPSSSHKKKKTEERQNSEEHSVDQSELNVTTKAGTSDSTELIGEITKNKDEDLCETNDDLHSIETRDRKKSAAMKKSSNESENESVREADHSDIKRMKRTSHKDNESKRIKEMARAMKMKIEDRELKEKSKQEKSVAVDSQDISNKPVRSNSNTGVEDSDENLKVLHGSDDMRTENAKFTSDVKSVLRQGSNSQTKRSNAEMFAANHGMSHCGYPVDGNVTYHQWNLAGTNIIIRSKYHGFISGQGLVHLYPKMEYQPNFGFEHDTLNEITRNWISVYTRPNSSLLKARINPYNSEIMMLENIPYQDLIPSSCDFSQAQAFTDLHVIVDRLKSLPVGEYILKNNPRKDMFSIMKATDSNKRGTFDLHYQHSSYMKTDVPNCVQWTPLDTKLLLPHQRKSHLIPCTYQPRDVKPGSKTSPKRTKKKGKKGKKQNSN